MAQRTELEISRREVMGKAVKRLRKVGIIPANVFGHNEAPMAIQIDALAFERLRRSHGTRSVLTLRMPGKKSTQTALIRHVQREPQTGKIIHVDFFRVSLSERIKVKAPLHFIGEAPAVKTENGVLLHLLDAIEIECVARDIPEYLEIDVSGLTEIEGLLLEPPDGAFYVFPDVRGLFGRPLGPSGRIVNSSKELSAYLLDEALVVTVPVEAFGTPGFLRFSYALGMDQLREGVERVQQALRSK